MLIMTSLIDILYVLRHPHYSSDIDECVSGTSGCNQTCSNTPGSFVCSCNTGFTKANKNCYDIDECAQNASRCGDNASCNNTYGGFLCFCNEGELFAFKENETFFYLVVDHLTRIIVFFVTWRSQNGISLFSKCLEKRKLLPLQVIKM